MYTVAGLQADLADLGIPQDSAVLIHSSFKAIGPTRGGPAAVLAALTNHFAPGLLAFPTHSWGVINHSNPTFNVLTTPSNVGILGEFARKLPGAVRTLHPTHSLTLIGSAAAEFAAGEHLCRTPTDRAGVYGKLYDADAYVVFLGAPIIKNTIIHGAELWAGVPGRLRPEIMDLQVVAADGTVYSTPMQAHSRPEGLRTSTGGGISDNYGKLIPALLARGIAWHGRFGDAPVVVCRGGAMIDYCMGLLAENPDLFLDPRPLNPQLCNAVLPVR